jgi:hypothetical protein
VVSYCWECEQATVTAYTVGLRANRRNVGMLTLCPDCYRSVYLPLAGAETKMMDVSTGSSHVAPRRSERAP